MRTALPSISVTSPADVVGIIPAMLGFHPEESIVLIGLEGSRRRVRLTMRVDLPTAGEPEVDLRTMLVQRLRGAGPDGVLIAVFTSEPVPPPISGDGTRLEFEQDTERFPYASFVTGVVSDLEVAGAACLDALLVGHGRVWSYLCRNAGCCPVDGVPIPPSLTPAAARFRAELVGEGRSIWKSRDQLVASVAPPSGEALERLETVFGTVSDGLLARLAEVGVEAVRRETVDLVRRLHRQYVEGDTALGEADAARISLGLADVLARDELLEWCGGSAGASFTALLLEVARHALPPNDTPICVALAWAAYQDGNGALAQCALDRAFAAEPDSTLGQLLQHALEIAIPPDRLRAEAREPDSCRRRDRHR